MNMIRKNEKAFEKALQTELNNITLPGEGEKAHLIQKQFIQYKAVMAGIERLRPFDFPSTSELFPRTPSAVRSN